MPHFTAMPHFLAPSSEEDPSLGVACCRSLRQGTGDLGVLDPDGLCVDKGVCAKVRQLATIAAVFDATDGNARVRRSEAVDENTAGGEVARDVASHFDVSSPEIAAQTKLACIGHTY